MDKKCSKCNETKTLDNFRNCNKSKDGKKYYCIDCDNKTAKERYEKQKNVLKKQQKDWQTKNKEKYLEYQKNYRLKQKQEKEQKKNETQNQ